MSKQSEGAGYSAPAEAAARAAQQMMLESAFGNENRFAMADAAAAAAQGSDPDLARLSGRWERDGLDPIEFAMLHPTPEAGMDELGTGMGWGDEGGMDGGGGGGLEPMALEPMTAAAAAPGPSDGGGGGAHAGGGRACQALPATPSTRIFNPRFLS